jgi:hypothetical protein
LSASEILLAAGTAAAGVVAGSVGVYLYSRNNSKKSAPVKSTETHEVTSQSEIKDESKPTEDAETRTDSGLVAMEQTRSIPKSELEKSKRELRTLLVEKELVSAALTRLYEAEAAKEITKSERELLGAKYVVELKALDEKITKMDAFIQIGDLETLRNQLLQLVEQKIDAIEKRIESTRKLAEPLIADMFQREQSGVPAIQNVYVDETQRGTPIPDISDMLQNQKPEPRIDPIAEPPAMSAVPISTPVVPKATSATATVERKKSSDKVEELQKEILEALDRLERLDVDSP